MPVVDRVFIAFACPENKHLWSKVKGMGRDVVTCGFLFQHCYGNMGRFKFEFFIVESTTRGMKWYDNWNIPDNGCFIDGYSIDKDCMMGVLASDAPDEVDRIYRMCRGCVSVNKDYNNVDRMLTALVPFYQPPDDKNIFDVESLHSAQAVVLILRECLDKCNVVRERIYGLNSRIIYPEALRDALFGLPRPHECVHFIFNFHQVPQPLPEGREKFDATSASPLSGCH
jgi:hypothetical protein